MKKSETFYFAEDYINVLQRRFNEVTEVLPFLLIGSHHVTADESLLRTKGITLVLSIGHPPSEPIPDIKYKYFEVKDEPDCEIKNIFEECFRMIEEERSAGGVVFVHCKSGISRAPTVAIAYLMMMGKISYDDALARVRLVRSFVQPNEGFVKQLKLLEEELKNSEGVS